MQNNNDNKGPRNGWINRTSRDVITQPIGHEEVNQPQQGPKTRRQSCFDKDRQRGRQYK